METQWLKTFICAAQTENFRESADRLFITQPAVSKHIKNLETALGTALFTRNPKTVTLNSYGHYFLPIAQQLVESLNEGLEKFGRYVNGFERTIRLGVAPQIANSILPILLKSFFQQNEQVHVDVEVMKSNEIASAIYSGKIDIGLSKIDPKRDFVVEEILCEPIVLIVPTCKAHIPVEQLLSNELILTHEYAPYWATIETELHNDYPHARFMKVNQTETIKNFVREQIGIAFLPQSVAQYSRDKELAILELPFSTHCESHTYFLAKYMDKIILSFLHGCQQILMK